MSKNKNDYTKFAFYAEDLEKKHSVSTSSSNELLCDKRHNFKDHEVARLVNELKNIAITLHDTQMLRDRISRCVCSFLDT